VISEKMVKGNSKTAKKKSQSASGCVDKTVFCCECKQDVDEPHSGADGSIDPSSIECESCGVWTHGSCAGFPEEVRKHLSLILGVTGIHWNCSSCERSKESLTLLTDKVEKIHNSLEQKFCSLEKTHNEAINQMASHSEFISKNLVETAIEPRFLAMEDKIDQIKPMVVQSMLPKLNSLESSYAEAVKKFELNSKVIKNMVVKSIEPKFTSLQSTYTEAVKKLESNSEVIVCAAEKTIQKDVRESKIYRDKNLILFGVAEASKAETIKQVKSILQECSISRELNSESIFRLGSLDEEKKDRIRPLKVCLDSRREKWDILKEINSLKKPGVFARLDLSPEERESDFQLRTELKTCRERSPSEIFKIYRGKVIKVTPSNLK